MAYSTKGKTSITIQKILTSKTASGIVPTSQASVAQLDRASVFGTDASNPQVTAPQELTDPLPNDTPKITLICSDFPSDLQNVINRWPTLPDPIKAAIQALIQTQSTETL